MAKLRVSVLISGRGSNLGALLNAAAESEYPAEIVGVISNRPDARGLELARSAGVPAAVIDHKAYPSKSAFEEAVDAQLRAWHTELVCLAGFMRVLSPGFTRQWEGRLINIHPSLLPAFPGLDTHKRAIEAGAKQAGCTVHFVVAEVDAGPILLQAAVPVLPGDTEDALAARVLAEEHRIYPLALRWIAEGRVRLTGGKAEVEGVAESERTSINN